MLAKLKQNLILKHFSHKYIVHNTLIQTNENSIYSKGF
jgi:hypothetical protein